MSYYETNIFSIRNLSELSATYRLYEIRGLRTSVRAEYFQNMQLVAKKLSYRLKTPALVVELEGRAHLVLRDDTADPPSPFPVVRGSVYFDRLPELHRLDFSKRAPWEEEICIRFLQFSLQNPLTNELALWRPGSGEPFFEKTPVAEEEGVSWYRGFAMRVVASPDGGLGVCVDVRNKFVESRPLPVHMRRDEFRRWKGRHCIYHFGETWYEVRVDGIDDLNISEILIPLDNKQVSLVDYIKQKSRKPLPEELARLSPKGAAIHYLTNSDDAKHAPAGLCYPVVPNHSREGRRNHRKTILQAEERRRIIHDYARRYLSRLRFGDVFVEACNRPTMVERKSFPVPDFEFGNGRKLTIGETPGAKKVRLNEIGAARAAMLRDKNAGFFHRDQLLRQYFFLPRSVNDSFGPQFVQDLSREVDELFPQKTGFDPQIVIYEDKGPRTFVEQGNAILEAAKREYLKPGHALVMIHDITDRRIRQHDQLAAMVVRRLRDLDIVAAVNHSATSSQSYRRGSNGGQSEYTVPRDRWGKFSGYLRNVALNKILLNNERWPFVLATPLAADLTIGIDVLNNTAGFTVIDRCGKLIRTTTKSSRQKEKLSTEQVTRMMTELLRKEITAQNITLSSVVVHRDGRVFASELAGMRKAMEILKSEGAAHPDASLTVLEVIKNSPVPLRLFEVNSDQRARNVEIGDYVVHGRDAFLCATGRAFPRPGTVHPLHVRYVEGGLPFETVLKDLFFLTSLTWTRPEDCSRYPITLKLNDRRLGDDASEYDAEALEFGGGGEEDES